VTGAFLERIHIGGGPLAGAGAHDVFLVKLPGDGFAPGVVPGVVPVVVADSPDHG
jgi:hypothetical protein